MIRIPNFRHYKLRGVLDSAVDHCIKLNMRIVVDYTQPVIVIDVTDLDNKQRQQFYIEAEYFVINGFVLHWMKRRMDSVRRGCSRKKRRVYVK